jgi:hypothetical protein
LAARVRAWVGEGAGLRFKGIAGDLDVRARGEGVVRDHAGG